MKKLIFWAVTGAIMFSPIEAESKVLLQTIATTLSLALMMRTSALRSIDKSLNSIEYTLYRDLFGGKL